MPLGIGAERLAFAYSGILVTHNAAVRVSTRALTCVHANNHNKTN